MGTARTAEQAIDQLNSFLRGEMSAVETYELALGKVAPSSAARPQMEFCMQSHRMRVDTLRQAIRTLGGKPATSPGAWGTFVKAYEGSATLFGDKAAISALERGEDHGLKDYETDLSLLDLETRILVADTLLPQQEETHRAMSVLKHRLS